MAPRISRHVLEAVFKRDDPRRPIAETYRQVAADAEPTTADILLDIAFIRRHPEELVQHWAGIGVRRLPQ
jgi:hypothetical protein